MRLTYTGLSRAIGMDLTHVYMYTITCRRCGIYEQQTRDWNLLCPTCKKHYDEIELARYHNLGKYKIKLTENGYEVIPYINFYESDWYKE